MCRSAWTVQKGAGYHDPRRAGNRKRDADPKIIDRAPIERLLDVRILAMHAVILGVDAYHSGIAGKDV